MTDMEHRGIDHVVVFIGAMLRKLGAGSADDFGLVHRRMEGDVLLEAEAFDLLWLQDGVLLHDVAEANADGRLVPAMVIDVIHDQEVDLVSVFLQEGNRLMEGFLVDFVIGVEDFEEFAAGHR